MQACLGGLNACGSVYSMVFVDARVISAIVVHSFSYKGLLFFDQEPRKEATSRYAESTETTTRHEKTKKITQNDYKNNQINSMYNINIFQYPHLIYMGQKKKKISKESKEGKLLL